MNILLKLETKSWSYNYRPNRIKINFTKLFMHKKSLVYAFPYKVHSFYLLTGNLLFCSIKCTTCLSQVFFISILLKRKKTSTIASIFSYLVCLPSIKVTWDYKKLFFILDIASHSFSPSSSTWYSYIFTNSPIFLRNFTTFHTLQYFSSNSSVLAKISYFFAIPLL